MHRMGRVLPGAKKQNRLDSLKHMGTLEKLARWCSGKEPACQCRRCKRHGFSSWVRKVPWGRKWQGTPGPLCGVSHGQRCLAGYSPRGCKEMWPSTHTYIHTLQQKVLLEPCLRCAWCDLGADEDSSVQPTHWHSLKHTHCPYYVPPRVKCHLWRWVLQTSLTPARGGLPEREHFPGLSSAGKRGWAGRMGTPKRGGDRWREFLKLVLSVATGSYNEPGRPSERGLSHSFWLLCPMAADCCVSSHACGHRAKEETWALTEGRGLDPPGDRSPRASKAESCLPQFMAFSALKIHLSSDLRDLQTRTSSGH